jgi:hypothetical protein
VRISRTLLAAVLFATISAGTGRPDDDDEDIEFPPGLLPFDLNGQNVWRSQSMPLGNTKYSASIGPSGRRKDAVDYKISVEKAVPNGEHVGYSVCFKATFKVADLPNGFLAKRIGDVVTFDGTTVTFDLGVEKRQFKLPPDQNPRPVQNAPAAGFFGGFEFWLLTYVVVSSMVSIAIAMSFSAIALLRFYRQGLCKDRELIEE